MIVVYRHDFLVVAVQLDYSATSMTTNFNGRITLSVLESMIKVRNVSNIAVGDRFVAAYLNRVLGDGDDTQLTSLQILLRDCLHT